MAGEVKIKPTATLSDTTGFDDGTYTVKAGTDTGEYELVDKDGSAIATSDDGGETFKLTGETEETLTFTAAVTTGTVTIGEGTATASVVATVTNNGLEAGSYTYVAAENALKDANGNVVAKSANGATFTTLDGSEDLVMFSAALTDGGKFEVGGIDVSSQTSANGAITRIQTAIETVSAERSKLGAYQNRLEHTINNLGASAENLTAAESRIRDVDMAKEMMEFTRANILSQAAQAMLAQANQLPQGVLQLLR